MFTVQPPPYHPKAVFEKVHQNDCCVSEQTAWTATFTPLSPYIVADSHKNPNV
jgi:hypothetical protein